MKFEKVSMVKGLGYTGSSIDLALSDNKRYLVSVGVYKPSVKIYDLENMALKVERHLESDPMKVLSLTEDSEKICILRNDRTMEFHARYGCHEGVKTPTLCFDGCLNKFRAEVMSGGKGSSIYRFNLDQGRFLRSYVVTMDEVCSIRMSECNGLIAIGGGKTVQFIDQRCREIVKTVEYNESPSSVDFSDNGIDFGVGTSEGIVYFHDLRARKALLTIKHDEKVKKVLFNGKILVSMDKHGLKYCNRSGIAGEYSRDAEMNCFACNGGVTFVGFDNGEINEVISEDLGEIPQQYKVL